MVTGATYGINIKAPCRLFGKTPPPTNSPRFSVKQNACVLFRHSHRRRDGTPGNSPRNLRQSEWNETRRHDPKHTTPPPCLPTGPHRKQDAENTQKRKKRWLLPTKKKKCSRGDSNSRLCTTVYAFTSCFDGCRDRTNHPVQMGVHIRAQTTLNETNQGTTTVHRLKKKVQLHKKSTTSQP